MCVRASASCCSLLLIVTGLTGQASASEFLARLPLNMTRNISDPVFKQALLAEIEQVMGSGITDDTRRRVDQIEDVLRPMFLALPKNAHGKLEPSAVQYALRRLFMRRQGWSISGLEPSGDAWDPTKASLILEDRAPEIVQELFKKHIGVHGTGLHEVAVLAAMMEHAIFEDMLGGLQQAYQAKQVSTDGVLSRQRAEEMVALHMAAFVRARDVSQWNPEQIKRFEQLIYTLYPNWPVTLQRMNEVTDHVAPTLQNFTFDDVAAVASEVGGQFAHWQNEECKHTKSLLLEMEDRESGRVRLVDFYNAALYKGRYQFTETITYLRQLGILDESDELNPKVIIANYVSGKSNCVARTSYYSVCCLDECEDKFGQLELLLGKPAATAQEVEYATTLITSSDPEVGPLLFSDIHRRRLAEVAQHHGGLIPLHGRLFAQWMHLAFPRECSFPHKSGTVYYKAMEEWEEETGERSGSTMEEIERWSSQLGELSSTRDDDAHDDDHLVGMWTMEEELVVVHRAHEALPTTSAEAASGISDMTKCLALAAIGLVWYLLSHWRRSGHAEKKKAFRGADRDAALAHKWV